MSVNWTEDGGGAAEVNGSAFSGGSATTKVWTSVDGDSHIQRSGGGLTRLGASDYWSGHPSTATGATSGVYAEATKVTGNSNVSPAVLDSSSPTNGYCNLNRRIYEFTANAAGSIIATAGSAPADGSVMKISRSGNDIVLLDDGSAYLSVTDTTYATNVPGIRVGSASQLLDDITLQGDESAAATIPPLDEGMLMGGLQPLGGGLH